jgi:hypothetical protein
VFQLAGVGVDNHVLEDVEGARHVFDRDPVRRQHAAEILGAAPRRHFRERPPVGFFPYTLGSRQLVPLAAAHALLQVVMTFLERILHDGHHRVVEF